MDARKENLDEMDCDMIRRVSQARRKNNDETVNCAAKVVESRLQDLQAKREVERTQQMRTESWQDKQEK